MSTNFQMSNEILTLDVNVADITLDSGRRWWWNASLEIAHFEVTGEISVWCHGS